MYSDYRSRGERLQCNLPPTKTKLTEVFKGKMGWEQKGTMGKCKRGVLRCYVEMEKLQKSVGGELLKMVCSVGWDIIFFYSLVTLRFLEQRLSKGVGVTFRIMA